MSTILKALRRLEEERTAKAERALRDQVVGPPPAAPRNRRRLLRILGACAGVALLGFGLYSWRARSTVRPISIPVPAAWPHPVGSPQTARQANPVVSKPQPALGAPAPQGASPPTVVPGGETGVQGAGPAPGPSPAELRAAAAALAPAPDVAVVQRPPPAPNPPLGSSEAPRAAAANPTDAAPGAAPPPQRIAPPPSPPEPAADAEDAVPSSVPIRLRDVDPSLHSPYGIRQESPRAHAASAKASRPHAAGAAAPEVVVTRTVWHPSPERRVAMVRAAGDSQEREVHEGESVGALQVLQIEPSDVVFLRDGVEIRQRVGAAQ